MDLDTERIEIGFTPYELATVIEAVHDSLFRKVRWTISPAHEHWKKVDFRIIMSSIDALSTAYTQSYMAFREAINQSDSRISPEYEKSFLISDNVWEVIDQILSSEEWENVEQHRHAETLCRACRELQKTPID